MASMLGKLIRPSISVTSKLSHSPRLVSQPSISNSIAAFKPISSSSQSSIILKRFANTSSNYHYHEKPSAHSHDGLWKAERYLSVALLGVLPAAAVIPHPIMDYAVALSLVVHVHWGIEAIVTDYVRPSIFGPTIPKVSIALVYVLSSLALGGLFMFNFTDVGITQATRMLAKI